MFDDRSSCIFSDVNYGDSSYNKTFYISQKIHLNWVDAYMFCRESRLKLAELSNHNVYDVMFGLQSYKKSENETILFDGSNLKPPFISQTCSTFDTSKSELVDWLKSVSCLEGNFRFLCEADENFAKHKANLTNEELWKKIQIEFRFFRNLGFHCKYSKFISILVNNIYV